MPTNFFLECYCSNGTDDKLTPDLKCKAVKFVFKASNFEATTTTNTKKTDG